MKTEVISCPGGIGETRYLPLAKLATQKEKWFEAIDKAIGRIRELAVNELPASQRVGFVCRFSVQVA